MNNNLNDELILAEKIIGYVRNKSYKNHEDYAAIIDLNYFISANKQSKETIESKRILEKLQNGYYDDVHKIKVDKKKEYKLDDDNIQYCFFWNYCELVKGEIKMRKFIVKVTTTKEFEIELDDEKITEEYLDSFESAFEIITL